MPEFTPGPSSDIKSMDTATDLLHKLFAELDYDQIITAVVRGKTGDPDAYLRLTREEILHLAWSLEKLVAQTEHRRVK